MFRERGPVQPTSSTRTVQLTPADRRGADDRSSRRENLVVRRARPSDDPRSPARCASFGVTPLAHQRRPGGVGQLPRRAARNSRRSSFPATARIGGEGEESARAPRPTSATCGRRGRATRRASAQDPWGRVGPPREHDVINRRAGRPCSPPGNDDITSEPAWTMLNLPVARRSMFGRSRSLLRRRGAALQEFLSFSPYRPVPATERRGRGCEAHDRSVSRGEEPFAFDTRGSARRPSRSTRPIRQKRPSTRDSPPRK